MHTKSAASRAKEWSQGDDLLFISSSAPKSLSTLKCMRFLGFIPGMHICIFTFSFLLFAPYQNSPRYFLLPTIRLGYDCIEFFRKRDIPRQSPFPLMFMSFAFSVCERRGFAIVEKERIGLLNEDEKPTASFFMLKGFESCESKMIISFVYSFLS